MRQTRKHFLILLLVMLTTYLLASCTSRSYHPYAVNTDLLSENWMPKLQVYPRLWASHVDPWFYNGSPNQVTRYAINTPMNAAMSDTTIRVSDFTNIVINGDFQVQIIGNQEHNSVSILGPNMLTRQVAVDVNENTLVIQQFPNAQNPPGKNVVIRIGMSNLRRLAVNGNGSLVGRGITSDHLEVSARGCGTVLLSGNINVTNVFAGDTAVVDILGAWAPCVKVTSTGRGVINIAGRIGIQSISNLGVGSIIISGANSDGLVINAAGASITRVIGVVNLKSVVARQKSQVYVCSVMSKNLRVKVMDNAYVGLTGRAIILAADVTECGFLAAKTLCADIAYIQACNFGHVNARVQHRLFAKSLNQGSIYYIGPPSAASRFTSEHGVILQVGSAYELSTPTFPYHEITSWKFNGARAGGAYTTAYGKYYP